jgi:hypothetical protein
MHIGGKQELVTTSLQEFIELIYTPLFFKWQRTTAGSAAAAHVISPDARTSKEITSERSSSVASSVQPDLSHQHSPAGGKSVASSKRRSFVTDAVFASPISPATGSPCSFYSPSCRICKMRSGKTRPEDHNRAFLGFWKRD